MTIIQWKPLEGRDINGVYNVTEGVPEEDISAEDLVVRVDCRLFFKQVFSLDNCTSYQKQPSANHPELAIKAHRWLSGVEVLAFSLHANHFAE